MRLTVTFICIAILVHERSYSQKLWGTLPAGSYKVGFKTTQHYDTERGNHPIVVCWWYPAAESSRKFPFKEYLFAGIMNSSPADLSLHQKDSAFNEFHRILELPFVLGLKNIPQDKLAAAVNEQVVSTRDAKPIAQIFPVIVISSEPETLSVTCEFLASQGFVVAVTNSDWESVQPPDSLLYQTGIKDLRWLLESLQDISPVPIDTNKIGALGFGGGIMPPFLLSMNSNKIKALYNMEGGVFQPASRATASISYHPLRMNTPMLHMVTQGTAKYEKPEEMNGIKQGLLYQVNVTNSVVRHQDFSIYGRMALHGLGMGGPDSPNVTKAYNDAHALMLDFFDQLLRKGKSRFYPTRPYSSLEFQFKR